ncbi:MAG TPA: M20/M25/M40 family metallo-hydrolase [Gemmatimonadales bacterium]|jgi:Zn-dependent M28 family amino/carboxypeptidase
MSGVSLDRLRAHVASLEGPRHPRSAPEALIHAGAYIAHQFAEAGLRVERRPFPFAGGEYFNVVASMPGDRSERPWVLVGAHYDTVAGTPGADDNASGVAAVLEAARLLTGERYPATIELVAFSLEEPQGTTYGVGSQAFVRQAREEGVRYAGALILEMVGYANREPGSQMVPPPLWWKRVPKRGTFLAAAGDGRSAGLLRVLTEAAAAAPELELVTVRVPFRGWLLPYTRLSDNCSFWDVGYPAVMLTDTAFLRNPHYHRPTDRLETLDFDFMARVTELTVETVRRLARGSASTV